VAPNPARSAKVTFTLPRGDKIDLGVYDLAGRRLATVFRGELPAGEFTKIWNGVDSGGDHVRAGVYFYQLKVGDRLVTKQAVKLE